MDGQDRKQAAGGDALERRKARVCERLGRIVDLRHRRARGNKNYDDPGRRPPERAARVARRAHDLRRADGSTVAAIDVTSDAVRSTIDVGLWPDAAEGTGPDGLAQSDDGATLFVAEAGDDAVAAIDVSAAPALIGAIPLGWYVTDVAIRGTMLYALDGNGVSGHPNPLYQHGDVVAAENDSYYVGTLTTGDLERLRVPDRGSLASGLTKARENAPYRRAVAAAPARSDVVKHVIYVIKENRTYDEVLGDDPRGNGDRSLAIFGRRITPNIHRLADEFVLLDDFEENGFVSADGHNWATAAYANDYVEKLWPADYAGRTRPYDFEGDAPSRPAAGYLWDDALAHGRTLRDYGEFVKPGPLPAAGAVSSLEGHVDPKYRADLGHNRSGARRRMGARIGEGAPVRCFGRPGGVGYGWGRWGGS